MLSFTQQVIPARISETSFPQTEYSEWYFLLFLFPKMVVVEVDIVVVNIEWYFLLFLFPKMVVVEVDIVVVNIEV